MTVTCDSALMTSGNTARDRNLKKHSLSSAVHGGERKKRRATSGGKRMPACPSAPSAAAVGRAGRSNLLGAVRSTPELRKPAGMKLRRA